MAGAIEENTDTNQAINTSSGVPERSPLPAELLHDPMQTALREGAEALYRSEARLRLITDAIPALIGYIDRDLRYTFCNRAYREWFGKDPAEIIGVSVQELIGQETLARRMPYIQAVLRGEDVRFSGSMPHHASGTLRDTDTVYVPDRDESEQIRGFIILMQDVTESRAAQREIESQKQEIVTIFERQVDAFIAFDTAWRFTYANKQAERVLGKDREELLGNVIWKVFPEARETALHTEYLRAMQTQIPVAFELYYGPLLGWFEIRAYPSPTGLSAYFRDITSRKEGEAERERAALEKARLVAELQEANIRQRRFLREMLSSLTEGRLLLCDSDMDLPDPLAESMDLIQLTPATLRKIRRQLAAIGELLRMNSGRLQDLVTAVSEAAMNAVVHAGTGTAQIRYSSERGAIQVWIRDQGTGIAEDSLHRATLEKGYSSAGTLGHGFWLMLKTADRVYLRTGATGTTIVLEQDHLPPVPTWLPAVVH